jgi:hypothetical protein
MSLEKSSTQIQHSKSATVGSTDFNRYYRRLSVVPMISVTSSLVWNLSIVAHVHVNVMLWEV